MKSESIKELALALAKAQGQFEHAKKDLNNPFFKSKYADLASVIDAAKKPLSDNGLAVAQLIDYDECGMYLETILMHLSGEWLSGKYPIRPVKNDPQGIGSATTYARRYAFSAIIGIAADDDDGNAASGNGKKGLSPQHSPKPIEDAEVLKFSEILKAAVTMPMLKISWQTVPADIKPILKSLLDECKLKVEEK